MNVPVGMDKQVPGPRALSEAEHWFARRLGRARVSEQLAFERWHAAPGNAAAYAQVERMWQDIGGLDAYAELQAMSAEALRATDPRRRRERPWALPLALAASVAVCVVALGFWSGMQTPSVPPQVYATAPHERDTVTLADGSRLQLNGDTEVSVRLDDAQRMLVLQRGEAVFEVAHDSLRPFKVTAGGGEVTALGTRFQVRRQTNHVTVTLLEGAVQLEHKGAGEQVRMAPGDQATYGQGGVLAVREVDPDVVSSWTRGRLLFRATPLAEVVEEVNRYGTPHLRLADPALGELPLSGTFPMKDTHSVAFALQALLPLRVVQSDDTNAAIELHRK